MKYALRRFHNTKGLTLVELLVAVAIGLILLGGIYQVFVSSTSAYSRNENMSRSQENSRFAAQILKSSVAGAGYLGCSQDTATFSRATIAAAERDIFINNYEQYVFGLEWVPTNLGAADELTDGEWEYFDPSTGVVASDDLSSATGFILGDPIADEGMGLTNVVTGSDILHVRAVTPGPAAELTASGAGTLTVTANNNAIQRAANVGAEINRRPLLIADCEISSLFYAESYVNATGVIDLTTARNVSAALDRAYLPGAQVYATELTTYYVRLRNGVPTLVRKIGRADVEELIEGVEMMQVLYGIDTSGDRSANNYVRANAITDWGEVVSVRIGLLLQAPNENLRAAVSNRSYNVNDFIFNSTNTDLDRRSRTVVNMTIGLRNRLR